MKKKKRNEKKLEIKYVNLLATVQKPLTKLFETHYTFAMCLFIFVVFFSLLKTSLFYFVSQRIIFLPLYFFHLFSFPLVFFFMFFIFLLIILYIHSISYWYYYF